MASHLEEFQSMGFEIDPLGKRLYHGRSLPSWTRKTRKRWSGRYWRTAFYKRRERTV
jgi:hypothetical protein